MFNSKFDAVLTVFALLLTAVAVFFCELVPEVALMPQSFHAIAVETIAIAATAATAATVAVAVFFE